MKNRLFIAMVAFVGVLAVLTLLDNIADSTAPLYGPPTVDREIVMEKAAGGELSLKEARFYSRETEEAESK